jgi:hypothetical protein
MSAVVIPINTPVDNTTGSPQVPTGAPNVPRRSIVSKPLRPAFFAKQRTLFDLATHYQPTVQSFSLRFADSRLETKFGDDYDERQVKPVTQNRLMYASILNYFTSFCFVFDSSFFYGFLQNIVCRWLDSGCYSILVPVHFF